MRSGSKLPGIRLFCVFAILAMMMSSLAPMVSAQEADTNAEGTPTEVATELPTVVPTDVSTEVPTEPAPVEPTVVPADPAVEPVEPTVVAIEPTVVAPEEPANSRMAPMAVEVIEAEIQTSCSTTATRYGAYISGTGSGRDAGAPQTITFYFSDGTTAVGARSRLSSIPTYYTQDIPGKTLIRVTAELDTARYPDYRFQTTINPCAAAVNVTGTVIDSATGEAIEGATVTIQPTGQSATTDASGNYVLEMVPNGEYTFTFAADGYEPAVITESIGSWSAARVVNASLTPVYGWPLGHITDAETGEAVPGATVVVSGVNHNGELVYETVADSTGVYKSGAHFLTGTEVTVTVSADGYVPQTKTVTVTEGGFVLDFALVPVVETPTTGTLDIAKYICDKERGVLKSYTYLSNGEVK